MCEQYDVIIIGAGIQGAGVAQAAALCGYKTLVIEKNTDAGMGTSCKSSKLIHGGLRYLESAQFKLVKESLAERNRLLQNAPDLVKLIPFHIPVYQHSARPAWMIYLGLLIYSLFSLKSFTRITKKDWSSLDGLNTQHLKQVFKYFDAQTDDQQLTRRVIHSACELGAEIVYQAEFISSEYNTKHNVSYRSQQQQINVETEYLINCSGPWAQQTQKKIRPHLHLPELDLIAGTHLIINRHLKCGAYYLQTSDNRAVFVTPWKKSQTLIGTTERSYTGDPDLIEPTAEEINYLIDTYNLNFDRKISHQDIHQSFCGLRVLPATNADIFNASRDSMMISNAELPGLITLIGGKLTTYRASAEEVIRHIKTKKQHHCKAKQTRNLSLD